MPVAPDLCGAALDGRYELHALIGEGAFGRVYRGLDRRLARQVAVKVIKPWWAEDPEWVASFEREAQLLARVSDPAIVQIFDVGHADEGLYYVSELVDGESLAGRLKGGPIEPWDAAALAEQLCRGLAHAHAQRIIHRDVKPANILISAGGRVKVGDFGVARLAEGSSDGALGTVVGTPRYMAPEQGNGQPTTPATDVYSAGVVLYEMLAGEPPFTGTTMVELALAHLYASPPPLPAATPSALAEIVMRALAKDPGDRYPEAGEMGRALAIARRGAPSRGASGRISPPPIAARAPKPLPINGRARPETDATRLAPPLAPRRSWNPAARRRTVAAFTLVLALLAGLIVAAVLVGRHAETRVPGLRGLARSTVVRRTRLAALDVRFRTAYSATVPAGTAIAQRPPAGRRVAQHSTVTVTLSRGRAPVRLPNVVGDDSHDAQLALQRAGVHVHVVSGPDPGHAPGTIYGQSPGSGASAPRGSTVTLKAAQTPRWQPVLTSFTGSGPAKSVPFTIRGSQWRIVYSMHYQGLCEFIFFCSGPTARSVALPSGTQVNSFGLSSGSDQTETIRSGPGTYQVQVTPGGSSAGYTIAIQDYY